MPQTSMVDYALQALDKDIQNASARLSELQDLKRAWTGRGRSNGRPGGTGRPAIQASSSEPAATRRNMTAEQRAAVSARMKKYWAERRKKKR